MEQAAVYNYSWVDFVFSLVGVFTFFLDWGADVWVATEFYRRGDVFWFGVLVGLMVVSSVLVQMFSWFWLQYDRGLPHLCGPPGGAAALFGERRGLSCLLHVLQLGFLCRHISAIRQGFRVWWRGEEGWEYAVYLSHDLSLLRLIETFSESAPQLTLMIYVMLRSHRARAVQLVSVAASSTSIAWMVVDYHRCLRSFLPDKARQGWASSLVYFLWNFLLIAPRLAALALFASVVRGLLALHLLLLWPALVTWARLQRTHLMDSAGGEWLYRATVGLIWYFSWFNVAEGRTRGRSAIYHAFMAADGAVLLLTWWFCREPERAEPWAPALLAALLLSYLLGLLFKGFYYCCLHPALPPAPPGPPADLPDAEVTVRRLSVQDAAPRPRPLNRRTALHAAGFYSARSV